MFFQILVQLIPWWCFLALPTRYKEEELVVQGALVLGMAVSCAARDVYEVDFARGSNFFSP